MSVKHKIWFVAATAAVLAAAGCGETGPAGPAGPPAWDLNANGTCDPLTEDTNGDGDCDMLDVSGPPGVACWDLDENGACDLATEDTNLDDACSVLDCRGIGTACWDRNENGACDAATEDLNADTECTVADCYGQDGVICWDLDQSGDCDVATEDTNDDTECTIDDCRIPGTACWDLDESGACELATEDLNDDGACTIVDCSGMGTGTVEGSVVDDAAAGIDGATVAFFPGTVTATADASGDFTIALPIGVYTVTASATGYVAASVDGVGVVAGVTNTLDPIELAAEAAANPLSANAGADQLQVGYGAAISLTGTGSGATTLTYAWTQTAGPAVTGLTGADTLAPSFTMPTIEAALTAAGDGYALPDRTQILGISPRYQGSVTMRLTVSGDGFTKTDDVAIKAAEPVGTVLNVGIGMNVFFVAAEGTGTWAWTLTAPSGSAAALRNAATRTPSFIPDVAGAYTVTLSGGASFDVVAGSWEGQATSCNGCHDGSPAPDMMTGFAGTNHATALARKLDDAAGHFGANCLSCHTVGYSAAATNNGFDDVMATAGWTFPATLAAGNWDALVAGYPSLARLAGIQCENCHGPNDSDAHMAADGSRQSMSAGMCAQCHDSGSHHYRPAEWATTPHASLELAREEGTYEARATSAGHCGRCHAGQGFLVYAENLEAGNPASITGTEAYFRGLGLQDSEVEPITCQTCHDPHDATNPHQIRVFDEVALLPGGFGVAGVGAGALCMSCHNTRNGMAGTTPWLHDDTAPASRLTSYSGPHYSAQADVLMGVNAFFVGPGGYDISPHAAITDTCVSCHMQESEFGEGYGDHTWTIGEELCASCHGEGVSGEAIKASVEARLHDVETAIAAAVMGDVTDVISAGTDTVVVRAWDEATDCYSSSSSSSSTVTLAAAPTAASETHIHGQTGFCFTMPSAVTWTRAGTGCSGAVTSTEVCFQIGSLKLGTAGTAIIAPTDPVIKAAWNAGLVGSDGSGGIHNPVWILDVLRATYEALMAR